VLSGTNDLKSTSGTYTNVTKVSVHEAFQPKTLDNDICTLKVSLGEVPVVNNLRSGVNNLLNYKIALK